MADDGTGTHPPEESQVTPDDPQRPDREAGEPDGPTPQPRSKESWEPQQRESRRPDFVARLAKTSDLPTEVPKERQKSKLGEHRVAALEWEEDPDEDSETLEPGEGDEEEEAVEAGLSKGQVVTLAVLGGVVVVLGAVWFAKNLLIGEGTPAVAPVAAPPPSSPTASGVAALSEAEYQEAISVMRRFLEAATPEDLRPVLREPDRVWPLVQSHHQRSPWKPFVVRRLPARNEFQSNRGLLAGAVEVDDYQRFVVAMQKTPDGIKVDWETFTGQGDMTWEAFTTDRPVTPTLMRVILRPDDYYNLDFQDSTTHACYHLTSHQDTHRLYGYVQRGSPVHALLSARTRSSPRIMPTLRLRYPDQSTSPDQIEIIEMVADGWLVTENTLVKEVKTTVDEANEGESPVSPVDETKAEGTP